MNKRNIFARLMAVTAFALGFSAPVFADSSVQFLDLQWLKAGISA